MRGSVKEEMYYYPDRFPSIWWHLHPIWTQMCKERPTVAQLFPNTADLMLREQVKSSDL